MTDEQIKQNAEAYALKKTLVSTDSFHGMVESYLAGVHARDEEIQKLKHLYEEVLHKHYEIECKLRNQWISVKDKLPNHGVHVLLTVGTSKVVGFYDAYSETWYAYECGIVKSPDYWMPIPETPKEE